jgi:hypothetical protein
MFTDGVTLTHGASTYHPSKVTSFTFQQTCIFMWMSQLQNSQESLLKTQRYKLLMKLIFKLTLRTSSLWEQGLLQERLISLLPTN